MKRSEQIEANRQWYIDRGIDVDTLIKKEREFEKLETMKGEKE